MSLKPKILVAFDFDHTVVDGNTDIEITKLCPEGKVPAEIKKKHKKTGWTLYMGAIFKFLKDHNISAKEMKETIQGIPLNEGMAELLKYLDDEIFEVIVISDSNSVFIDDSLEKHGFKDVIKTIYTNPAYYDESGLLHIEFYHTQDWCNLSTENLCKGHILNEHIKQSSTKFSHILYIGDGYNDLCPALRLNEEDYVFPRMGFALWKKINKLETYAEEEDDSEIRAKIVDWSSGLDILKVIEELCGKQKG